MTLVPLGTRYVDETNLEYISLFFPVFLVESAVLNNFIIVFISYLILYILFNQLLLSTLILWSILSILYCEAVNTALQPATLHFLSEIFVPLISIYLGIQSKSCVKYLYIKKENILANKTKNFRLLLNGLNYIIWSDLLKIISSWALWTELINTPHYRQTDEERLPLIGLLLSQSQKWK